MKRRNLAIIAILLSTVMVSAAFSASLDINPKQHKIQIGRTGHYKIILKTDVVGSSTLHWDTGSPDIFASIGGQAAQSGDFNFNSNGKTQVFTLDVTPQPGAVIGHTYHVNIGFQDLSGSVDAEVTGDVVPTPELTTGLLTAAGLLGLIGIVRYRRKE